MLTITPDELAKKASELAGAGIDDDAAEAISDAAGDDRRLLEATRDLVAAQVRARVDDWEATGALRLLNRALADLPRSDPLDWQVRWEKRRKP